MSRIFVLITLTSLLLVLTACTQPTEIPSEATKEPVLPEASEEAYNILAQQIEATGIISLDYIDQSTADGWPKGENQSYEILGATTNESPPNKAETIIGVLYIREEGYAYPPNTYLVQYVDDTKLLLTDQDGGTFEAFDVEPMTYEELGLEQGLNYFLFAEGSLRCIKCPKWLLGLCYCYRCQ
jgi:hypothetical protein